jgi:hypothetical protein
MTEAIAPAVGQADVQFADPAVRARIRAWHEEGVSLLDMGNRLGIVFDDQLRDLIAGLSPAEVATIRKAMIAAIDRGGQGTDVKMPIDCTLDVLPPAVVVTPEEVGGEPFVRVTAGPRPA